MTYRLRTARNVSDKKRRDARRDLINQLKDHPCMDCGQRFHPWVMEFDHVRGKKFANIGRNRCIAMSLERFLAEIDKCDLVCANCHRMRTYRRQAAQQEPSTCELVTPIHEPPLSSRVLGLPPAGIDTDMRNL